MIQLNNDFLVSIGLGDLPAEDKQKMLQHIYETLELRVGMRLAKQMSDEQLDEFEKFVDGDIEYARQYLSRFAEWENDPIYQKQIEKAQSHGKSPDRAITEFAALKWLSANFPDHKQAIEEELEKLKVEIKAQAPQILQATLNDANSSPAPAQGL